MSSLDFYLQNKDGADKFAILYNREKRYNYDVLLFASFGRIYLLDGTDDQKISSIAEDRCKSAQ
jgi:hypothetical protein